MMIKAAHHFQSFNPTPQSQRLNIQGDDHAFRLPGPPYCPSLTPSSWPLIRIKVDAIQVAHVRSQRVDADHDHRLRDLPRREMPLERRQELVRDGMRLDQHLHALHQDLLARRPEVGVVELAELDEDQLLGLDVGRLGDLRVDLEDVGGAVQHRRVHGDFEPFQLRQLARLVGEEGGEQARDRGELARRVGEDLENVASEGDEVEGRLDGGRGRGFVDVGECAHQVRVHLGGVVGNAGPDDGCRCGSRRRGRRASHGVEVCFAQVLWM